MAFKLLLMAQQRWHRLTWRQVDLDPRELYVEECGPQWGPANQTATSSMLSRPSR